ncbi:MAG: ATP-dependent DNA helicase RecG [Acidimicrobiia bacterium]|nr:ATP-dependent DNA helicase RecG [Acidimicrobiia bacterium]
MGGAPPAHSAAHLRRGRKGARVASPAVTGPEHSRPAPPLTLAELDALPVSRLRGVGERKQEALAEVGVRSVLDLLTYYPRRYIDRTRQAAVGDLRPGDEATVVVEVLRASTQRTRGGRSLTHVEVADEHGRRLRLGFFNQSWRERQLQRGAEVVLFGRVEEFRGRLQMTNPVVDLIGDRTARIVPVYPQSDKAGLSTWEIAGWVSEAMRRTEARRIADPVPGDVRRRFHLVDRHEALHLVHVPDSMEAAQRGRARLVFDELLRVQLALVERKRHLEATLRGARHDVDVGPGSLVARFVDGLPFPLTAAQRRVVDEIRRDLEQPHPMHRLLQGDVGAGKTLVALAALLVGVQGGHQGALMAPTEVLAEQHHLGIRALLEGLVVPDDTTLIGERPVRVELLTHRTTAAERRRLGAALVAGQVDVLVGTHALIQDGVAFADLGVVVIDEQHRFGVEQRAALRERSGENTPDVLVMTATPIPRTAAMTVYGDLDVSVLDELPPGRTPIHTVWARDESSEAAVWAHVRDEVAAGRQAYVVCPLIEESERVEAASAEETHERLVATELSGLRLGLLHGRLAAAAKEEVMSRFRRGDLDVLVATTVIEVGVDVPNATVMVILAADRFGIAQLHQLRGRVGRGAYASVCYLVGAAETPNGEARLAALAATTDGFELAEVDLDLRGEGTLMSDRQTGRNDLKLASLRRDRAWVDRAREVAFELVGEGGLAARPELAAEVDLLLGAQDTDFLLRS